MNRTDENVDQLSLHGYMRQVAHELGNPVASIRLSAEILQTDPPEEMRTELLEIVLGEAQRMESLIESAVYFTAIAAPRRTDVSLADLIDAILRGVEGSLATRSDLSAVEDGPLQGDLSQLSRLFREIAANAVDAGATRLEVSAAREDDRLLLRFEDDGEGAEPEQIDRLAEPFFTTREARMGLGLTIARRIAEGHGGSLDFAGRTPSGLVATVSLPLQDPQV